MGSLGEAVFDLSVNMAPFAKGMKDTERIAEKGTGRIGGALSTVGSIAGGILTTGLMAGAAGGAVLMGGLGACVAAAMDAEQTEAQLNAVLMSTKGAAGMSKDAIIDLAMSLSQMTPFEDDAIVAGESMLLTFTNIGADVFPAATLTMLDMSQAIGQDMKSSAVQLGKALNDPIAGISALSRVGVTFTDAQKEVITAMVEAGNVAGAQKLILSELTTEFGGSAVAAGQTLPGQLTILKNTLGNVSETIGGALIPALTGIASTVVSKLNSPDVQSAIYLFSSALKNLASGDMQAAFNFLKAGLEGIVGVETTAKILAFATGIQQAFTTISTFIQTNIVPAFQQIAAVVMEFVTVHAEGLKSALIAIGLLLAGAAIVTGVLAIGAAIAALANPVTLIIGAVALLGMAWSENWGGIQQKTQAVLDFIMPYVQQTIAFITAKFQQLVGWVTVNWPIIQQTITNVITFIWGIVQGVMTALQSFWAQNGDVILAKTQSIWSTIQSVIGTAIAFIHNTIQATINVISALWAAKHNEIMGIVSTTWALIQNTIQTVVDVIQGIIRIFMDILKGDWTAAWRDVQDTTKTIWDDITTNIRLMLDLLQAIIPAAWEAVKAVTELAWDAIKGVISGVWEGIQMAISGKIDDVKTNISTGWDTVKSRATSAWDTIKETISGKWDSIVGIVRGKVDDVREAMGQMWSRIYAAAGTAWENIKYNITHPIEAAQGIIQRVVDTIKGTLEGLGHIHIVLPHFTWGTRDVTVAGITFPIPDIGINWYGKGLMPTLFNRPTLIGVGENGPEMISIMPLSSMGGVPGQMAITRGEGSGAGVIRQYNLQYTAVRQENGTADAARAMREIGLWAELEG